MNHIYLIVYAGFKQGYRISEGNTEILRNKLIDSIEDIRSVEKLILADSKINNVDIDQVVITWYNLLRVL